MSDTVTRRAGRRLATTPLWLRLVTATLLLVAVALVATGFVGATLMRGYLVHRIDTQLESAGSVKRGPPPPNRIRPPRDATQRVFGLFYVVRLDSEGRVADELSAPTVGDLPKLTGLTGAEVDRRRGQAFTVDGIGGSEQSWRVVATRQDDGGSLVMAASLADVHSTVNWLLLSDLIVGAVVLAGLGLCGYVLVRVSLRPLVEMEDTAAAIAAGDLSRRVPDGDVPEEVARLGRALNGMLAQIESAFRARASSELAARGSEDRMRRFVADASHELRTPLTSIRGFSELYRQEGAGDPEAARLMRRIEDEASRMGVLVEDLLLLARLDQRRPLERNPVDLLSLAAEAVLDAQSLAADREIDLVRLDDEDGPVVVIGDEARLRQIIGNLVTNALTHTPEGTPFRILVGRTPRGVVMEVADEGPGLAAPDAERVFERFYRADPSRNRALGGSGLGLSIVVALAHAHEATMELETAPGHGATFRVILPEVPHSRRSP